MATRLPLHELHVRLGARWGEVDGQLVPLAYGDVAAEYGALRTRAGLADRSGRGLVAVTGRDRAGFLHALLSNDVKGLGAGQGCAAALLDHHGRIVSLMVVHCLADRLLLEMDRPLVAPTMDALERFHISERVELEDASDREGLLTVVGPAARAVVEKALETPLPELPVRGHGEARVDGTTVRVVRHRDAGEDGYDLWLAVGDLGRLAERLLAAGAEPVGWEAWEVLRVEAGRVRYGVDVDATTLLLEAPLEEAYSLTKGCYLGQEVVARITYRGHVNRKVVGFLLADARLPARGAPVLVDGREVGRITSAVVSPSLGRAVALGFLRREHWAPGTLVEVAAGDGRLQARVVDLPFPRLRGSG